MKRILDILILFSALLITLTACQQEKLEITPPPSGTTITKDDAVAKLISRVARLDGSVDNIIDQSSCLRITLPVTVIANGQTLVLTTLDDLKDVEKIFDASLQDDDKIEFEYPIEVVLSDFTTILIDEEDELEDLIDACEIDDDIECIDINYPIIAKTYNTNNQVSGTLTINNDEEFFFLLKQLLAGELMSLDFPITLTLSSGSIISVADFEQLEDAIDDAEDDCDEDDDNDFNDDDVDDTDFVATVTSGTWRVDLFTDPTNRTAEFTGYVLTFNVSGEVTATKNTETETGEWESDGDSGKLEFELEWDDVDLLEDISVDWTVVSYNSTAIQLQHIGDDGTLNLNLKKN
jgi:hypothetical protein